MMNEAQKWLTFAHDDVRMASLAYQEAIYNQTCFHAQQCVEKCLKALLVARGSVPPKVHSIAKLLALLDEQPFDDLRKELIAFDRFYVPTRYPEALPGTLPEGLPTEQDAREALALAQEVFVRTKAYLARQAG